MRRRLFICSPHPSQRRLTLSDGGEPVRCNSSFCQGLTAATTAAAALVALLRSVSTEGGVSEGPKACTVERSEGEALRAPSLAGSDRG